MSEDTVFIIGDGDDVRKHIDRLMLSHRFDELSELSDKIDSCIKNICAEISENFSAKIIYSNGDGFLARARANRRISSFLKLQADKFNANCGISLSVGMGSSIEECLIELKKSKAK